MDPLSITASVAGIATLVFQVLGYISQVKAGGKDRLKLSTEITHLWLSITALQEQLSPDAIADDKIPPQLLPLFAADGILHDIQTEMEDLDHKLKAQSTRGKIRQTLAWPFTQQDVLQLIQRVQRLQQTLHIGLTQSNYSLTREIYRDGRGVKKTLDESWLREMIEWMSPLNFVAKQKMLFKEHHEGSCKWFLDSDNFHAWREGEGTTLFCPGIPGAGKTFLSSIVVNELDRLKLAETGGVEDAAVVMLYCKWDDQLSQSIPGLLASMIKQIIQRYGADLEEATDQARKIYSKHSKEGTRPALEETLSLLNLLLKSFPKLFVIVDGLDELRDEKDRLKLLQTLTSINTTKVNMMVTSRPLPNIVRHFRSPEVVTKCDGCGKEPLNTRFHCAECDEILFEGFDLCESCYDDGKRCGHKGHVLYFQYAAFIIDIAAVEEDLTTYVQWRIESSEFLQQCVELKDGLMDQIVDTVVKANDGMFLLAKFNMDTLDSKLNTKQVIAALKVLPKELDGTYMDAMHRIAELPTSTRETVMEFLRWVVFAEQPLQEHEIEHALAVSEDDEDIDDDGIIRARVLADKCAGLVQFDEADCVRLVHFSAENFFRLNREKWFPDGSPGLVSTCLTYLLFTPFKSGACSGPSEASDFEERLEKYPLLSYACVNWGKHLLQAGGDEHYALAKRLLTDPGYLTTATQALWYLENQDSASWSAKDGSGLHLATHFGLTRLVEELLREGHDPNIRDVNGVTPLALVAVRGGVDIAAALIQAGARVNVVDNMGGAPLHRAIMHDEDDITRLLMQQKDIDVNISSPRWSNLTPLMIAAANSSMDVLELLLNHPGIELNKECSSPQGATALMIAAQYDQVDPVKRLAGQPGIDIDHQDEGGSTALIYAAEEGYYSVVEALLDHGANTEVLQFDTLGTALLRAIDSNNIPIVLLLLKRGANVHHKDCFDRGMLHGAAVNGRAAIIRTLLSFDPTLDVNMQDAHGKTTLHDAALRGDKQTAEVLLEHGGNPTIKDNHGRTPIRAARELNNITVMELLRAAARRQQQKTDSFSTQRTDTGTIIQSTTRSDTTGSMVAPLPLWTLGSSESPDELKQRLSNCSTGTAAGTSAENIDITDPDMGQSALHYAAVYNKVENIHLLLSHGANINLPNRYGRTPLHVTALTGSLRAAQTLLDAGADPEIRDQWGSTVLLTAQSDDSSLGVLLIARGAAISDERLDLNMMLERAARYGDEIAVRRLVEAGAETARKNRSGMTPYMIAKMFGHEEIGNLILRLARPRAEVVSSAGDVPSGDVTSEDVTSERESRGKNDALEKDGREELQSVPEMTVKSSGAPVALKGDGGKPLGRNLYVVLMVLVLIVATATMHLS